MRKKRIYKDIIFLLVSTLITMVVWVSFEVYRAYFKTEFPEGIEKYLENLDPKLKGEVFTELEAKSI